MSKVWRYGDHVDTDVIIPARYLNIADFDLERIFGKEGVGVLHLSGLIAALSPETGTFCLELASLPGFCRPRPAQGRFIGQPQPGA